VVWTAHLPSNTKSELQVKEEFESFVKNSRGVFDRVLDIINDYMEPNEVKPDDYDCPSWACKQADLNGYNRALKKVRELFT